MSKWQKPARADERLRRVERKVKKMPEPSPCGHPPAAVTGVDLSFHVKEVKTHLDYAGVVKWNPVTTDANGESAQVERYFVQLAAVNQEGNFLYREVDGRPRIQKKTVEKPDSADDDWLHALFPTVIRPRTWYYKARVRAIDTSGCKGPWSPWTPPVLPPTESEPGPPAPGNWTIDYDRRHRGRDGRYRMNVSWGEILNWDVPGGDASEDVAGYQIQIRASDDGGKTWEEPEDRPGGKEHYRTTFVTAAKDEDPGNRARASFFPVYRHHIFQVRGRTIDRYQRRGEWSPWWPELPVVSRPTDRTPPPKPRKVETFKLPHRVGIEWEGLPANEGDRSLQEVGQTESDPEENQPESASKTHRDVAFFQVELSDDNFKTVLKRDKHVHAERKVFWVRKLKHDYWLRVRSVDAANNHSDWVKAGPVQLLRPTPPLNIRMSFDEEGKKKHRKLRLRVDWEDPNWADGDIDRYVCQMQSAKRPAPGDIPNFTHKERKVVDAREDTDDADHTHLSFRDVSHKRVYRVRMASISKGNVKSPWSGWIPDADGRSARGGSAAAPRNVRRTNALKRVGAKWQTPKDDDGTPTDDIAYYQVQRSTHFSFADTYIVDDETEVVANHARFPAASPDDVYFVRLRSVDDAGNASPWHYIDGRQVEAQLVPPSSQDHGMRAHTKTVRGDELSDEVLYAGGFVLQSAGSIATARSGNRIEIVGSLTDQDRIKFWTDTAKVTGLVSQASGPEGAEIEVRTGTLKWSDSKASRLLQSGAVQLDNINPPVAPGAGVALYASAGELYWKTSGGVVRKVTYT